MILEELSVPDDHSVPEDDWLGSRGHVCVLAGHHDPGDGGARGEAALRHARLVGARHHARGHHARDGCHRAGAGPPRRAGGHRGQAGGRGRGGGGASHQRHPETPGDVGVSSVGALERI